ncbi:MAG: hypothetical protein R3E48_07050 [Burkholderiaceae bacterium]
MSTFNQQQRFRRLGGLALIAGLAVAVLGLPPAQRPSERIASRIGTTGEHRDEPVARLRHETAVLDASRPSAGLRPMTIGQRRTTVEAGRVTGSKSV